MIIVVIIVIPSSSSPSYHLSLVRSSSHHHGGGGVVSVRLAIVPASHSTHIHSSDQDARLTQDYHPDSSERFVAPLRQDHIHKHTIIVACGIPLPRTTQVPPYPLTVQVFSIVAAEVKHFPVKVDANITETRLHLGTIAGR